MIAGSPDTESPSLNLAGKYLACNLGREFYAIPIAKVREIIRLADITPVPHMPAFIRGVINLHGKITPVADLRLRLGLEDVAATDVTCIVVVQTILPSGMANNVGLIVDRVDEVINIMQNEIEETPEFGPGISTELFLGFAQVKGKVTALLNINEVLTVSASEPAVALPNNL